MSADPKACPIPLIVLTLITASCATTELMKDDSKGIQVTEVPKEFREKFEVEEVKEEPPAKEEKKAKKDPKKMTKAEKRLHEKMKKKRLAEKKKKKKKKSGFQYPNRRPKKDPVWLGEKQYFDVTFMGLLAGVFTLEVKPFKKVNERKVYHFFGNAKTSKIFSFIYTLDDNIESFMDYNGLFSHRFELHFKESAQIRNSMELHDSEKKQTFFMNIVNHKKKGFKHEKFVKPIDAPFPQDMISFLYYLRLVDLPKKGGAVKFPIVSEGKTWEAIVTVVRREFIRTPLGRKRAVVVKPETKFQGRWEKRGDSFIWVIDDDRRFIARVEAKVKIGKIKAELRRVDAGKPAPATL